MPNAMRSFDPRRVGRLECTAWVTYYRREWWAFLRAAVGLTRHTFALPWPATLRGAWLVLRANQLWAPYPDNDPDGARRCMERFYRLVAARHGETFDVVAGGAAGGRVVAGPPRPAAAARPATRPRWPTPSPRSTRTSTRCPSPTSGLAARERALAMRHSDRWVQEGCDLASPLVREEREALVRSYAALLAAVHRG